MAAFKKDKKEDPKNYRLVSLTSIPGMVMEQLTLETLSEHVKDKKVMGSGQRGRTKGKVVDVVYRDLKEGSQHHLL